MVCKAKNIFKEIETANKTGCMKKNEIVQSHQAEDYIAIVEYENQWHIIHQNNPKHWF